MATFLFFLTYFIIGYVTFRVWVWFCPIQKGPYGTEYLGVGCGEGWYVPAWMIKDQFDVYRKRGQAVGAVFWESILGWPLLWSTAAVVGTGYGLRYLVRFTNTAVMRSVMKQILPPRRRPPPKSLSEPEVSEEVENL